MGWNEFSVVDRQRELLKYQTVIWHVTFPDVSLMSDLTLIAILREKGRDLTQSYDKSPYTNSIIKNETNELIN